MLSNWVEPSKCFSHRPLCNVTGIYQVVICDTPLAQVVVRIHKKYPV